MSWSERDHKAARERQAWIEAEDQKERDRIERPIKEMEAQLAKTAGQLLAIERERLINGKDDSVFVDPAIANSKMTWADAATFNKSQFQLFLSNNPDFHPSDGNLSALSGYFKRNGLAIINVETLRAAVDRLNSLGLLEEKPEPPPTSEPEPVQTEPEPTGPIAQEGVDLHTGLLRQYGPAEIERMSANQFRRAFRVKKVEELVNG